MTVEDREAAQDHRLTLCAMPVTPESVPELRRFARRTAQAWRLPGAVEEALSVVVTELGTNVLLHSGSPYVVLLLRQDGVTVTAEVRDGGRWRPRRTRRRVSADANAACGRGLLMVEAYAADCTVVVGERGTRVVVELRPEATT